MGRERRAAHGSGLPSTSAVSASRTDRWSGVRARTVEATARHYTMAWPNEEPKAGRPSSYLAVYGRLAAAGACFGEKLGVEAPHWFAGRGETARDGLLVRHGRTGPRQSGGNIALFARRSA